MTSEGSPRTVSARAIATEDLVAAELNARTMGNVSLVEALELTALVALRAPRRRSRHAARWLTRFLSERPGVTLEDAAIVVAHLGALGGPRDAQAVAMLRGLVGHAERIRVRRAPCAVRHGPVVPPEQGSPRELNGGTTAPASPDLMHLQVRQTWPLAAKGSRAPAVEAARV
jgi:hypothetical protein